jgi:hypothetical protein
MALLGPLTVLQAGMMLWSTQFKVLQNFGVIVPFLLLKSPSGEIGNANKNFF